MSLACALRGRHACFASRFWLSRSYDITYRIVQPAERPGIFEIDDATGKLRINGSPLDFEARSSYSINAIATTIGRENEEGGNLYVNCSVDIEIQDVNDAPRVLGANATREVLESAAKNTFVGDPLRSWDEDANQEARLARVTAA